MTKKLPKDLIPGEASGDSVVHASDEVVGFSRGHKEGDISRLQSAAHNFDDTKQYKVDDLVIYANVIYRNKVVNTPGNPFVTTEWDAIGGIGKLSDLEIDTDKDWQQKIIKNHGLPVDDNDVSTKKYVDDETLEPITNYDTTKSYKKGESALWINQIVQIAKVNIPAGTVYDSDSWLPVNIKRTSLLEPITIEQHKHTVTVTGKTTTGIIFRDQNHLATIPFLELGDFISIVGTDGIPVVGIISVITPGITATYDVELDTSDIEKITEADHEATFLNRVNMSAEIKGVIINKKDYTDKLPHLTPVDILLTSTDPLYFPPTSTDEKIQLVVSRTSPTIISVVTNNDFANETLTEDNLYLAYFSKITLPQFSNSAKKYWGIIDQVSDPDVINAQFRQITNLKTPINDSDAVPKKYVDEKIVTNDSIEELTDTEITNPIEDQSLVRDANEKWINKKLSNGNIADNADIDYSKLSLTDKIKNSDLKEGDFNKIKSVGIQNQDLDLGDNKVKNLKTPTDDSDAVPKKYVDDKVDAELLNYDSNKLYQEGESALFSNIEQTALVDIPPSPIYYPENWLPINIHNSKLITNNSLDFFEQEVSINAINHNTNQVTMSNPSGSSLSNMLVNEFIGIHHMQSNGDDILIIGKIMTIDNTANTYTVEIDSQTLQYLIVSSSVTPPLYYTVQSLNYLTNSALIQGYIRNVKDYSDGNPHLSLVGSIANQTIHITPSQLNSLEDINGYVAIDKNGVISMVSPRPDTFDQDYLLLVVVGRETTSHFHTQVTNPWFIDIIEKITENTQLDTKHEGLILPYSNQNPYEEGQEALYNDVIKITAINNVSAGKDYDPEDWISNVKESQVDSPNLTLYGDGTFEILTKTNNVITVKYLSSTHILHILHDGDFVAFPSATTHYDSTKVAQVSNVQYNGQTGETTATLTFDPIFSPVEPIGNTIQLRLLNYLGIFSLTRGVIVNQINSSDDLPHPHFINLDFYTEPVYISPAELNIPGYEKDIFVGITEPHKLQFQQRNISKDTVEIQTKLFLAISNRETQDRFENDTNKYWINFALQYKPNDNFGAPISNIGKGTQTNDAVRLDQAYEIAIEEATKHFTEDYSESASFYKGKQASFNGIIQRANKDIANNTPYNPEDWQPPHTVQQSGLVENAEIGLYQRGELNYYVDAEQGGPDPIIFIKSTIAGIDVSEFSVGDYLYLVSNIPGLDGNLARIKTFNPTGAVDTIEFELDKAITLPNNSLRITAFEYPNRLILKNPAIGAIVNKKFSDDKYHMIPVIANNPGITTHTDKFDYSFDGWSVYDVPYSDPPAVYGSIHILHSTEHGGSLLLDLAPKLHSYYFYGGTQKAFAKDTGDTWDDITFDWRTTGIPVGDPQETATKLLCRILNPIDGTLLKEVVLVYESLLADSGWRNDTIDISDLNAHDSLLITIVFDDHRWLDAQLKLYLDNFKIKRIHGTNYILIPTSDLSSPTYHKIAVIHKDNPTQFSLIEPPTNRDSLHEYYIYLADIRRSLVSRWPTSYYAYIGKFIPYLNLQAHLNNKYLANYTRLYYDITNDTTKIIYFNSIEGTQFSNGPIQNRIRKEDTLEEIEINVAAVVDGNNVPPSDAVKNTTALLEILVGTDIVFSKSGIQIRNFDQQTKIPIHKSFSSSDVVFIRLTFEHNGTIGNYRVEFSINATWRSLGV